ncbi:hypothetical protein PPTG_14302 [Phytophthora nicotianae INRA-310]|uniref:Prephenate dehydratase domain-containing protein n=1 Tax=Phytophthora nicotianae (strain INRA-310) TaxID=761204 RepID=W2PXC2_PHYN3|nr:hypothetical protein PPTG_14302 [Phytophthora nicotianae INRA-310]ETN05608.1 hypothetical protein PPTG_14302 [Phytophthora nicotianae INRA-310]
MAVGMSTRVAYNENAGSSGAKAAANEMLSAVNGFKTIGYATIEDAIAVVKKEDAKIAVVPAETSTHGSYYEIYDLLLKCVVILCEYRRKSHRKKYSSRSFWNPPRLPLHIQPPVLQLQRSLQVEKERQEKHKP